MKQTLYVDIHCSTGASALSVWSFFRVPFCPTESVELGACATAFSRAAFHSCKSSVVSAWKVLELLSTKDKKVFNKIDTEVLQFVTSTHAIYLTIQHSFCYIPQIFGCSPKKGSVFIKHWSRKSSTSPNSVFSKLHNFRFYGTRTCDEIKQWMAISSEQHK